SCSIISFFFFYFSYSIFFFFFFFFQAEDGIRDRNVTGVQTCALPILPRLLLGICRSLRTPRTCPRCRLRLRPWGCRHDEPALPRSEERRVGKECRSRWWR